MNPVYLVVGVCVLAQSEALLTTKKGVSTNVGFTRVLARGSSPLMAINSEIENPLSGLDSSSAKIGPINNLNEKTSSINLSNTENYHVNRSKLSFLKKCFKTPSQDRIKQSLALGAVSSVAETSMLQSLGMLSSKTLISSAKSLAVCSLSRAIYISYATQIVTESLNYVKNSEFISKQELNPQTKCFVHIGLGAILAASIIFLPWMLVLEKQRQVLGSIKGITKNTYELKNVFQLSKYLGLVKVCLTTLFLKKMFAKKEGPVAVPMAGIKTVFTAQAEQVMRAGPEVGQNFNPKFMFWYFIQQLMFYIGLNKSVKR